jgi:hypothetical protein
VLLVGAAGNDKDLDKLFVDSLDFVSSRVKMRKTSYVVTFFAVVLSLILVRDQLWPIWSDFVD